MSSLPTGHGPGPAAPPVWRAAQPGISSTAGPGVTIHVLGVDYVHTITEEGGDLYLTADGLRHPQHLQPRNWFDRSWFRTHREALRGTGAVYAVPTRPVAGESLGLVVKFSRVGEHVPIDIRLIQDLLSCEFNGPFEEFSLVEDLRHGGSDPATVPVRTQVPLAIYVPPDRMQPSQSGRFQWRIDRAVARHPGVAIDILRRYIMVYRWLPGVDAAEAYEMGLMTDAQVQDLTKRATAELHAKGFNVLDMKPAHLIVQLASATSLLANDGQIEHGVIDYELLERTADYRREVKERRREAFARRRRKMHEPEDTPVALPAHLHAMRIWGVDYIQGRVESTGGVLWVVGRDPELFDLFLPERWRTTPQVALPQSPETYSTESKDNIRLVWTVSSVGERPPTATLGAAGFRLLSHGYNSPFEEAALARWLLRRGVPTVLPAAIYQTGHHSLPNESRFDKSRYWSHQGLRTADGTPILDAHSNYIGLWEEWHAPEPRSEIPGESLRVPLDARQALEHEWLTPAECETLVKGFEERLLAASVEPLWLGPQHLLVARLTDGSLRRDPHGRVAARLCRFEFLRWLGPGPLDQGA
jgi:hypothetical protein